MINLYKKGQKVRCSVDFRVDEVLTDPSIVNFKFKKPSGGLTMWVYGTDIAVVREATGLYYADVITDEKGEWSFRFEGTGICTAVEEASFNVTTVFDGVLPDENPPTSELTALLDAHIASDMHLYYNVKTYGAQGTYMSDDTLAIQSAIDAAQLVGGKVYLPNGTYKITSTLIISSPITFEGESVASLYGSIDDAESRIIGVEIPTQSPYLMGAVLVMDTPATDVIKITVVGKSVHLKNFGVKFADAIRFTNTGNGIYLLPATNVMDNLPDFGIFDSNWENVFVWGHDGTHYAFKLVNMVLSTFTNLRSYGGGGIEMYANTNMTSPGNCVIIHPYIVLFCGATAQGIYIHASGNTLGCILNTFIRPQVNFIAAPVEFTGITAVNVTDQRIFNCDAKTLQLSLISPNFETTISGGWLIDSLQYSIYPAGGLMSYMHTPYGDFRSDGLRLYNDNGSILAALFTDQIIIKSPNGTYHAITVSNDNVISSTTL